MKKVILTALVVSVLMAVFCFSAFAGSGATEDDPVTTFAELKDAITAVADGTSATIYVDGEIVMDTYISIAGSKKIDVTFKGVGEDGATILANNTKQQGVMFELTSGGSTYTFENITLDARAVVYNKEANTWTRAKSPDGTVNLHCRVFAIYGNSTGQSALNLKAGTVVKGGYRNDKSGPALLIDGGILNIYDGAIITENWGGASGGGAIYAGGSTAQVNMYGGEISYNLNSGSYGGGGISAYHCTVNITGGKIHHNDASSGSAGGGGIAILADSGKTATLNISGNVEISDNVASGAGYGAGAIYGRRTTVNISGDVLIKGNKASQAHGGAIRFRDGGTLNIDGATFTGNVSAKNGGVIYAESVAMTIENAVFDGNKSTLVIAGSSPTVGYGACGGVYVTAGTTAEITDCVFSNNEAAVAGALQMMSSGSATVTGCFFYGNKAVQGEAGAVGINGTGENIFEDCHFGYYIDENEEEVVAPNESVYRGGAISVRSGKMEMYDSFVKNNSAKNGGGIVISGTAEVLLDTVVVEGNTSTAYGAGLAVLGGNVAIDFSEIKGNKITGADNGGGIYVEGSSTVLALGDVIITENEAYMGAGIRHYSGEVILDYATEVIGNIGVDGAENNIFGRAFTDEETGEISYVTVTLGADFEGVAGFTPFTASNTATLGEAFESVVVAIAEGDASAATLTCDTGDELVDEDGTITLYGNNEVGIIATDASAIEAYENMLTYRYYKLPGSFEGKTGKPVYGYLDAEEADRLVAARNSVKPVDNMGEENKMFISVAFINIETEQGASVRLDGTNKTGLRVITKVNFSELPEGTVAVPGAVIGTELADGTLLKSSANGTTIKAIDMEDCQYLGSGYYAEMPAGFDKAFTVAVNLGESFYATDFYFRGYVTLTLGEESVTVYADFDAENYKRSARQVAQAYAEFLAANGTWDFETECFEGMSADQYKSLCALAAKVYDGAAWVDAQ